MCEALLVNVDGKERPEADDSCLVIQLNKPAEGKPELMKF